MSKRFLTMSLAAVIAAGIMTLPVTQSALADGETVMTLDTEYDVSITYDDTAVFSFTPEEDGWYGFKAYNLTSGEIYAELYDEDGDWCDALYYWYESEYSVLGCTLEAGETYTFNIETWYDSADFSVMIYEAETIESISAVSLPATEYDFYDTVSMEGAELEVTYSDGSTSSVTMGSYSVMDPTSASYIYCQICNESGETVSWGSAELPAGTYSVYFYSGDVYSEANTVTVNELTSYTELQLDADYDVSAEVDNYVWFTYTPETSGKYAFASFDLSSTGGIPYVYLYNDDYSLAYDSCSNGDNFLLTYSMEAGETYYFKVSCYEWDSLSASFSVRLYEAKTLENIAVSSLVSDEFEAGDTVSMEGSELELTYTDGSTSLITVDGDQTVDTESGNYIYYVIYDENGYYASWGYSELSIGTYTVIFYAYGSDDDVQSEEYTFAVTAPAATELELDTAYDVSIESGNGVYFSYTPEVTGRYAFESYDLSYGDPYVTVYDSNFDYLASNDDGGDGLNFLVGYYLEAGETYYFYAQELGGDDDAEYTVKLYECKTMASITATSLPATEYDFFDTVSMYGAELEVTYTDGTSHHLQ